MVELSNERIGQMLHEESLAQEDPSTILRGIYVRYMRLYERYFADVDALDDEQISEMAAYHEETKSLVKYYYLDIPQDVCRCIVAFDKEYSEKLLGPGWRDYLADIYADFKRTHGGGKDEQVLKAEFKKQTLDYFYEAMDYVFRDAFGTGSKTISSVVDGIANLLFGKEGK